MTLSGNDNVTATFNANPTVTSGSVPANVTVPAVSGTSLPEQVLTCANGTWTNDPTAFTYRWNRGGAPIPGATVQTYTVQITDEAQTLTCTVTASNASGAGQPATSAGALVALPGTLKCPAPTGRLKGLELGPLSLGMTRKQARARLPHYMVTYNLFDDYCLFAGWGIRAGYPSTNLLQTIPRSRRAADLGRLVLVLTANPFYALDGVRPGAGLSITRHRLHLGTPIQIGRNSWYVFRGQTATAILKVRHGVVQEVGIASRYLTSTREAQTRFLHSFPRALY